MHKKQVIGIISDTHGVVDRRILEVLRNHSVTHIVHAGDVMDGPDTNRQELEDVLELLEQIAPVTVVRGNNDDDSRAHHNLPGTAMLQVGRARIFVHHSDLSGEWWHEPLKALQPDGGWQLDGDIVVSGHTHIAGLQRRPLGEGPATAASPGVLFLNPGSAGPRRGYEPRHMALLTVHPTSPILQVQAVHLGICPLYRMAGEGSFPKAALVKLADDYHPCEDPDPNETKPAPSRLSGDKTKVQISDWPPVVCTSKGVCHGVRVGPAPDPINFEYPLVQTPQERAACASPQPEDVVDAETGGQVGDITGAEAAGTKTISTFKVDSKEEIKEKSLGRRRQLQWSGLSETTPEASETAWLDTWAHRFSCWWLAVPPLTQERLGGCLGALGVHLASRLDASLRSAGGASSSRPMAVQGGATRREPGCEWVAEHSESLKLPRFPDLRTLDFTVPPLPRLLPHLVPNWRYLQSLSRGDEHEHATGTFGEPQRQQQREIGDSQASLDWRWGFVAVGAGGGTAMAVVTLALAYRMVYSKKRSGRLALQRQLGSASGAHPCVNS